MEHSLVYARYAQNTPMGVRPTHFRFVCHLSVVIIATSPYHHSRTANKATSVLRLNTCVLDRLNRAKSVCFTLNLTITPPLRQDALVSLQAVVLPENKSHPEQLGVSRREGAGPPSTREEQVERNTTSARCSPTGKTPGGKLEDGPAYYLLFPCEERFV